MRIIASGAATQLISRPQSGNNTNDFCFLLQSCRQLTRTQFRLIFLFSVYVHTVADDVVRIRQEQSKFVRWVDAYRTHSHRMARTNPIEIHAIERFVEFTL